MALAKEFMCSSIIESTSFSSSTSYPKVFLNQSFRRNQSRFLVSPAFVPLEQRRTLHLRKVVRGPVAAISEDLVRNKSAQPSSAPVESKPVSFKVRAVVTVRNKNKEDFKETLIKHLDAITDKIGRNVVLELVSTQTDPSKSVSPSGYLGIFRKK